MPRFVFASGSVIDLLVRSKVGPFMEFQLPKSFNIIETNKISPAPMTREDIFSSQELSLVEKRKLMRFLTECLNFDQQLNDSDSLKFLDFMAQRGLSQDIIMIITTCLNFKLKYSDVLALTTIDGINEIQKFMKSTNKYGPSPILSANYGTGSELCQSFCRYAAVNGASYILDLKIQEFSKSVNFKVKTDIETFTSNHLLISESNILRPKGESTKTRHLVCISQQQFGLSLDHSIYLQCPNSEKEGILGIQSCVDNQMCPDGIYILHLQVHYKNSDPRIELENIAKRLSNGFKS